MIKNFNVTGSHETKRVGALRRPVQFATLAIVLMTAGSPAFGGLIITPTFGASVAADFLANTAAFETAWTSAAAQFTSAFTDNIHININVEAVTGTGTLGASSTPIFSTSYSGLRSAVVADAKSADDNTSIGVGGSVAATDPTGGADTWWVTKAQRKALGMAADDLTSDGTTTFGAGFNYDFNSGDGVGAGQIDLIGVIEHEISEVMGRIGISLGSVGGAPSVTLLDEFAYTGAGTRGLGFVANDFFSINNGSTLLKQFNQVGGGDSRDWQSGTNDSFNAFSSSGVVNGLSATDLREMDVLGYDAAPVPEPSSYLLFASVLLACVLIRRRVTA